MNCLRSDLIKPGDVCVVYIPKYVCIRNFGWGDLFSLHFKTTLASEASGGTRDGGH